MNKKIYDLFEEYRNDFEEKIQDEIENVINRILNRVQYLIKKDAYKNEEEVRIFLLDLERNMILKKLVLEKVVCHVFILI